MRLIAGMVQLGKTNLMGIRLAMKNARRKQAGPATRLLILMSISIVAASCSLKPKDPPNVIIIIMDTVTVKHLSVYGFSKFDTTPNLRDFAEHATRYTRAYSTSSWTLPSHGSLFTGLYPTTSGVHFDKNGNTWTAGREFVFNRVPESAYILPEALKDNGFVTGGFSANGALVKNHGFVQGYDVYFGPLSMKDEGAAKPSSDQVNAKVLKWLDEKDQGRFFLFINYMDAHAPRIPRPELGISGSTYLQAIRFIDTAIGQVFEKLREMDQYDNSMIFILSDHGEHFGEKGYIAHGNSLYEPLVRVPMLVKLPGQRRLKVQHKLVSWIDIFPTILAEVDIEAPDLLQGQHLDKRHGSVFFELTREQDRKAKHTGEFHYMRGLVLDNLKLIESEEGFEIYDLGDDPAEESNLFQPGSPDTERLLGELKRYDQSLVVFKPSGEQRLVDEKTEESLRSLGYLR